VFKLDVTPPSVSLNANLNVFSPNGDGNKDVIVFNQETSAEDTWYGYITNEEDERVLTFKWVEKAEPRLRWDGRGEEGTLLDDGVYYYQLAAEDRAGNSTESRRVRFELDTKETEVLLTAGSTVFSPNGDGRKDTIRFLPKLQNAGDVVSYRLAVENEDGEEVRVFEESGSVPDEIRWDGFMAEGGRAPDGTYRAAIRVTYRNGNQPTAKTQPFGIDTQVPSIEVTTEYTLFSPDGDGNRDSVMFRQDSSEEDLWQGEIRNEDDDVVKSAFWKGEAGDFVWDGTDNAGNVVPDGTYTYVVQTEDKAGNRARETVQGITVDTAPTKIFVTASGEYLSPNGDGMYEEIAFNTIVNRVKGLESWFLELVDGRGNVQRRFEGSERVPKRIVWDGTNEDGEYVEGTYTARFGASYTKGNEPRAESLPFVLDRSAPQTNVQLEPKPFSPDNDGVDDELTISLDVEDRSSIDSWSFKIYDTKGNLFKEYGGTGSPAETLIWDGRGKDGELVLSAMDYPYEFTVSDVLANERTVEGEIPVDVLVVREDGQLKIKISNINFQPNSAEFVEDDPEIAERNQYVLDRVAEILQKYRQYEITIEGHAVITKWYDEEAAEIEQEEELLPLSEKRAERVLNALVERGVSRDRLNAVGVGGEDPLVPHSDQENRWKNRRVEFILEKE
jgi:outer membrane protein OmpA-like peptidoglycan-associated protein/flagellar hook assembly protein FlgD